MLAEEAEHNRVEIALQDLRPLAVDGQMLLGHVEPDRAVSRQLLLQFEAVWIDPTRL